MIGLIVAMRSEFDMVFKALRNPEEQQIKHLTFATGQINNQPVVLMQSGMGKVNAALATCEMIENFHPEYIINTGLAGGLSPELSVMDIVLGEDVVYHDVWCGEENEYGQVQGLPPLFHGDKNLINKAAAISSDIKIIKGLITSGDQFISDITELKKIKNRFPSSLAVDMESAAIAQTCYLYNTPFLSIRIISDTPGIDNHYQQYLDFWNKAPEKSCEIICQLIA